MSRADGVLYRVWDRVAALRLTGDWATRKRQVLDIIVEERRLLADTPSVEPGGTTEHEHSEWECGVMVHVGSRHWMDDPCTLTDEDRCRFAPYRNTRLDLRTEKP